MKNPKQEKQIDRNNRRESKIALRYAPLSDLKPYENNAKLHPPEQILKIVKSISALGMIDPIGIDDKGVIVEGHGRYEAAKILGLKSVPVINLDHLSAEEITAYRIAHNKLTLDSDFDSESLSSELEALQKMDIDFELSGFSSDLGELDSEVKDKRDNDKQGGPALGDFIYQIVVKCQDEAEQRELLTKLEGMGLECRALIS